MGRAAGGAGTVEVGNYGLRSSEAIVTLDLCVELCEFLGLTSDEDPFDVLHCTYTSPSDCFP